MTASISTCCKWHFFPCLSMWNNCILPLAIQSWSCQGHNAHQSPQVQNVSHWGPEERRRNGGGEEKNKIKNARHAGRLTNVWPRLFCTLQSTAIHSGEILSAFFSFIPKLLKTTLWIGRWSMSFLLHAISHHPCPPPPAYIHTSFNSNRKSKWREKGKSAQLEHFSHVSSGNKSPGVLSSSG